MKTTALPRAVTALVILATLYAAGGCWASDPVEPTVKPAKDETTVLRVRVFDAEGELTGPVVSAKIAKTDAEWRAQLTEEQFRITRGAGTERAFCGTLLDHPPEGVYACECCGLPLFSSASKFHSGTGWPSFFQPIAKENVAEREDKSHGMVRTEINCARCDAHLGHVFEDGPRPTGLRYCLNSESLTFTDLEDVKKLADPAAKAGARATVVFAGGCFWCVEAVFEELDGVIEAVSGYAGGTRETANYKAVCTGATGHAEAVQIVYDPTKITYEELLKVHFATHDPTTLNRQGADEGPQYRSAIFFANEKEKELAQAFLDDVKGAFEKPIVTTLEPLKEFFPAETYHQNYVCQNPGNPYIRSVALPKVEKVRKKFKDRLKETSPLEKK
jgi:peptide methionine sulfoxide reductase msrA/msrB